MEAVLTYLVCLFIVLTIFLAVETLVTDIDTAVFVLLSLFLINFLCVLPPNVALCPCGLVNDLENGWVVVDFVKRLFV